MENLRKFVIYTRESFANELDGDHIVIDGKLQEMVCRAYAQCAKLPKPEIVFREKGVSY